MVSLLRSVGAESVTTWCPRCDPFGEGSFVRDAVLGKPRSRASRHRSIGSSSPRAWANLVATITASRMAAISVVAGENMTRVVLLHAVSCDIAIVSTGILPSFDRLNITSCLSLRTPGSA